jgi:hypothetical protein
LRKGVLPAHRLVDAGFDDVANMDSPEPTALIAASPILRMAPVAISVKASKPPPADFAAASTLPTASLA